MNPELEIRRLLDLMPASGRMLTKIVSKPEQSQVITSQFPLPWMRVRPILINFDLWSELKRPQRDMLLLHQVSRLTAIRWFKPDLYQGLTLAGAIWTGVEFFQGDVMGTLVAGMLAGLAGNQIWRSNNTARQELAADDTALEVAQRRGYEAPEAARHLITAIEAVAQIERRSLTFMELVRCHNLRAIAGLSPVGAPQSMKRE
ncbi:MAG: DUF3318 domain-containing protein [Cyanobacteria bacterium]|nr:DUF3318 domain-containing protein [Cyanobacteriota bacterium]MDW8199673.1 DUF3318 domain-containing protein [Cyanobacteriota bacterium SKYGB_h_bin112]